MTLPKGLLSKPAGEDRVAFGVLVLAMAASSATLLWLNRGTTFSRDELTWVIGSPDLTARGALQPHGGHLILTSRLVYKFILEIHGSSYFPFRLLSTGTVLLTAGLFFVYARRKLGNNLAALAPTLVLLFFGSDPGHVLQGNGFTVLLAISCGLGAFIAVERADLRGDVCACALLCLGVATYSVALPFVVGVTVLLLSRQDRWRRLWIVGLPITLYLAWWLWARGSVYNSNDQINFDGILQFPTWSFQALSASLTALVGLNYNVSRSKHTFDVLGQTSYGTPGIDAVAVLALAGLAWRLTRRSIPSTFWAALAVALTLWLMGDLTSFYGIRRPYSNRYLYPGAVAVLLVGVEATSGIVWTRSRLFIVYTVVAVSLATNVNYLRVNAALLRNLNAPAVLATFTALDLADGRADPKFDPGGAGISGLFNIRSETPTAAYLSAAQRYGSFGFSLEQLRDQQPAARARADAVLAHALGLRLTSTRLPGPRRDCRKVASQRGDGVSFMLPPGGAILEAEGGSGPAIVRRFGDPPPRVSVGDLSADTPMMLRAPRDGAPDRWFGMAPGTSLLVCRLE